MVAVILLLAFHGAAAGVIFWVLRRSLRRSRPEIPSTVPQEWVDEFGDRR
jgi:hypothetical protein